MFEEKRAMFIYCVSPVHMGAGTSIGAIDSPIQRERHTGHPMMAGSGIKGALRHEATGTWGSDEVVGVFGPDTDHAGDHAGAVSFGDAQIVLFPVRSLRCSFVYATCPTALARLMRLLDLAGVSQRWIVPTVPRDGCVITNKELLAGEKLVLETYQFSPNAGDGADLKQIAKWLGANAIPEDTSFAYFRDKIANDTVVLSDDRFNYFVKNATVVEPHVRISDETGTAEEGGLFYTENLPPESLLVSLAMASRALDKSSLDASEVMANVTEGSGNGGGFNGSLVQIGGDATTGRGQVVLRFAGATEADNG